MCGSLRPCDFLPTLHFEKKEFEKESLFVERYVGELVKKIRDFRFPLYRVYGVASSGERGGSFVDAVKYRFALIHGKSESGAAGDRQRVTFSANGRYVADSRDASEGFFEPSVPRADFTESGRRGWERSRRGTRVTR